VASRHTCYIIPKCLNACFIGSILAGGQGLALFSGSILFHAFLGLSLHISLTWAIQQVFTV